MNLDINTLQKTLCNLMCTEVKVVQKNESLLLIKTPFFFPDGDPYQIYIKELTTGIIRLTDMGHTMMHLSYDNEVDKFRQGTRGELLSQILSETEIKDDKGEFYIDTPVDDLGSSIFRLGQGLTKINDLTFINRFRAESTFYEDLEEQLNKIIPEEIITKDYYFDQMENATDYPIDYKVEGKHAPLFLFGIPNRDKARLTTIILERLLRTNTDFDSLLIFSNQKTIPPSDLARLSNAGGEMIASLDAESDFSRKVMRKINMN